ncbi:major facilitator transporter [Nocardia nova SH22a]|uniref:Major facilitator transporter n=1 Tax=Nocardia nova SH22a TaxID=1415166 RepID=W5TFF3_9NOCA|nr:MFS transporter [Nocardia nova]AHH15976.1 major facilitator transporter [Nocardia nova SH22a]
MSTLETRTAPIALTSAPHPARWRILPVILSAMFMAMFDWFVVNVAASSLQHDLHAGESALELIVGGYGFAFASALITGGRLGDLYGHRRLFVVGMLAFAGASLLCGLAPNAWSLVAFRILQGATAALMVPQLLALINTMFPPAERARAMAGYGATIGLGAVAGQVLGGVLLDANLFGWGWRTIFYINVPIGVAAALLAARWLPHHEPPVRRPRLDPVGALGISTALALLLVPMTLGRPAGWPLWTWLSMAAAIPVLLLTLRYENRLVRGGGEPVIDIGMVRARGFGLGLIIAGGYLTFFAGFMLCLTLTLQNGLGLSPLAAGMTFAPLGLCFAGSSLFLAPRVANRLGNRVMVAGTCTGITGLAITLAVLYGFGAQVSPWALVPGMMIVGLGNGLTIPSVIAAVLSSGVPATRAGMAAGVLTTAQQFGNAIGATVLGVIFFSALGSAHTTGGYAHAMEAAGIAGIVVLGAVLTAALALPRQVH